ncbi:phosphotransferase family protein [Actinomadura roseirufa]|uniref:phosphotransferase family protein n=1 Tax=Actinomadura roseirufa TaxID=2094049 RepID=UPI0010411106|nr:aminoglycoside phosphotransferase family protein [Actinomadura roseirufa]
MDVLHRVLLAGLLPHDEIRHLTVREGQFHRVVLGSDRVVRLPRTPAAAARLPGHAAVLRALSRLDLGFGIPEPLAEGEEHLVLSRIPGVPLDDVLFDEESVAIQYTALLDALAQAGGDEEIRAALPHSSPDHWRHFASDVRAELFPLMSPHGRLRAEQELQALDGLPHLTDAVVHGDLGPENVLWETRDGLPRLTGVVDWDEAALGDPAEDLAAIGAGHGPDLLNRIRALGGWTSTAVTDRIAAVQGTFALQQALAALQDGDDEELADGLTGYR